MYRNTVYKDKTRVLYWISRIYLHVSVCLSEGVQVLPDGWSSSSPRPASSSSSSTSLPLTSSAPSSQPPPPPPHNSRWGPAHRLIWDINPKQPVTAHQPWTWMWMSVFSQYPCLWTVGCSELSPSHSPCTALHGPISSEGLMQPPSHGRVGGAGWPPGPTHSFWGGMWLADWKTAGGHWILLTIGDFLYW